MHAEETQLQLRRDLMLWYVAAMTREPKTQRLTLPPTGPLLLEREFEILSEGFVSGASQLYKNISRSFLSSARPPLIGAMYGRVARRGVTYRQAYGSPWYSISSAEGCQAGPCATGIV
jgi:hypothetical protein